MLLANHQPLFAWDALDDSPALATIKHVLATLPDAPLLDSLRQARGHGRNDHPVRVLWGVVVLTILLRHVHFAACLAELRRNDDLRVLIGISRDEEDQVPDSWNVSRFLEVLGQEPHLTHLRAVFDHMVQRLGDAVPDLGTNTAGDSSALNARRTKKRPDAADPAAPNPSGDAPQLNATAASAPPTATAPNVAATSAPPAASAPNVAATSAPPGAAASTTGNDAAATAAPTPPADKVVLDRFGLPVAAGGRKEYTDAEGKVTKVVEWFGFKFHLLVDVKHEVALA